MQPIAAIATAALEQVQASYKRKRECLAAALTDNFLSLATEVLADYYRFMLVTEIPCRKHPREISCNNFELSRSK